MLKYESQGKQQLRTLPITKIQSVAETVNLVKPWKNMSEQWELQNPSK